MKIVKIRRVGNSNVVSIPREFEEAGFAEGAEVVVDVNAAGQLTLTSEARLRERVRGITALAVEENREALEILAAYDRGEAARPQSNGG